MKTPDTFDELQKLWDEMPEPINLSLDADISEIIWRVGTSARRLFQLYSYQAPTTIISGEIELGRKWNATLCARRKDFISCARVIVHGKHSEEKLWDHRIQICADYVKKLENKIQLEEDKEFLESKFDTCPDCGALSPVQHIKKCGCGRTYCCACGIVDECYQCFCGGMEGK